MKKLFTSLALMSATFASYGQSTATNFTANDCNNVSHTLFTELDNGTVIVLVWIMPCGMCVTGSNAAYNAVQSFATSNPGKVKYYLIDDIGDGSCAALNTWASNNGINPANITIFGNAGTVIKESDFGGSGMPHVAVIGGPNHQVFFNERDNDTEDEPGITNAISAAIGATSITNIADQIRFTVAPNPAMENLIISYSNEVKSVSLSGMNGQVVMEKSFNNGKQNPILNIATIASGAYLLRITDTEGKSGVQQIIKK